MEEEYSAADPAQLLQAASDFDYYPGMQNEASIKEFVRRFPLPVIINALQTKADVPGLENALVACLERIFKSKYGASLIPQYMPFLQVGLRADSEAVRSLACKAVSSLFENLDDKSVSPAQLIIACDVYPLLLDCLVNGNEQVAAASMDAIKNFASSPEGIATIFPADSNDASDLRNLMAQCSSLGRVRVLALIVKLFSVSPSVASVIYNSKLLALLESEVSGANDTLVTLSVLELLYEMTEVKHAVEFLSKTSLLQLISTLISNTSMEPILRSRAMIICGRMLSKENIFMFIDENSVRTVISAIEGRLVSSETGDADECESALEALGQIGSSMQGATLLLLSTPDAARFLIGAAFGRQSLGKQRLGKQMTALLALGNIAGENRSENAILNGDAEENLRRLIYEVASQSSKLTLSGLFLSILQQESEIRLAGYRVISGLVARPWCLMEICSKQEIINILTDSHTESTKIGMEARYNCCQTILKALVVSASLRPILLSLE
ncbi:hypothetical protein Nepgr_026783 [Nepenthes gracilis]|uniref:ARM repeat superfamily protein n=1 Tax=Nepenthes gracilis TaxID=150966 RepID=A0AAD3T8K0_NEPGR|nr:hypothetical protein Nepgr_026783 [Nepenthes gracilis]